MNRRDVLKATGASLGVLSLSSIARPLLAHEDGGPGSIFLPQLNASAQQAGPFYRLSATPSGSIGLQSATGAQFGQVGADYFRPLDPIVSAIRNSSSEVCQADLFKLDSRMTGAASEDLSAGGLMSQIPLCLLPVFTHPINTGAMPGANYSLDMLLSPVADPGGTLLMRDVLPLDSVDIAGNDTVQGGISVGNYFIRISMEKHFLGGCIKRDVWHAGALVKYKPTDRMIFDLHIAAWWSGSTPCVGVYESRSGFCRTGCASNMWQMIYTIVLAAAAIYLAYWLAAAITSAIATAGLGVLVAIPGVPPPP